MGLFDVANKIGAALGLGGKQGEHYQAAQLDSPGQRALNAEVEAQNSANVAGIVKDLQAGKISLKDALARAGSTAEMSAIASSPIAGSIVASEQVRSDPLTSGLLGEDGALSRAITEEKDLSSRGYSLQPEDYEAYGQGSDQIARNFAVEESSLASALADRGLASADSGVARQQFSGVQGNKFEHLGQLQRQIADDRMTKNLQRLTSTRDFVNSATNTGIGAQHNAFNRNLAGAENRTNTQGRAASGELAKYQAESAANQAAMESKLANKEVGLGDALSKGFLSGVQGGVSNATSSLFAPKGAPAGAPPPMGSKMTTNSKNYSNIS